MYSWNTEKKINGIMTVTVNWKTNLDRYVVF